MWQKIWFGLVQIPPPASSSCSCRSLRGRNSWNRRFRISSFPRGHFHFQPDLSHSEHQFWSRQTPSGIWYEALYKCNANTVQVNYVIFVRKACNWPLSPHVNPRPAPQPLPNAIIASPAPASSNTPAYYLPCLKNMSPKKKLKLQIYDTNIRGCP